MREAGFTLLEVLVAFAIVVIFSTALYEASAIALRTHERAMRVLAAGLLADSVMARFGVENPLIASAGDLSGSTDGCAWQVHATQTSIHSTSKEFDVAPTMLFPVNVTVEVGCGTLHSAPDVVLKGTHLFPVANR